MNFEKPKMRICINAWVFCDMGEPVHPWPDVARKLRENNIQAVNGWSFMSGMREFIKENDLLFSGGFDFARGADPEKLISDLLEIGDGPINCQLGNHDTPTQEAVELAIEVMEASAKLSANVHIEGHRDTATETPEKFDAIIEGYIKQTGQRLKVNFDYSHPAIIKHLLPDHFSERLITRPDYLQESDLIHLRPFNGHHCQIPITDGRGAYSYEFENYIPFARDVINTWLSGDNVSERELWLVPELGPYDRLGYGLSCFPEVTEDVFVLAKELQKIWNDWMEERFL